MATPSRKSPTGKSPIRQFSWNWMGRGYVVAVMGSMWLLRCLRGGYGVCVQLVFVKNRLASLLRDRFAWKGVTVVFEKRTTVYVVFLRWFYFREFRESDCANISTSIRLFVVKTSENRKIKLSRISPLSPKSQKISVCEIYGVCTVTCFQKVSH